MTGYLRISGKEPMVQTGEELGSKKAAHIVDARIVKESFTQAQLSGNTYTVTGTYGTTFRLRVVNLHATNSLTVAIGSMSIVVPAGKELNEAFAKVTTMDITGTALSFSAFIAG